MIKLLKKYIKIVLCLPPLNALLRAILKSSVGATIVPRGWRKKIPVSGEVCVPLPDQKTLHFRTDGGDYIGTYLYWDGVEGYESDSMRVFRGLLPEVRTFLDVGANTGVYALIAAIDNASRRVYAFEAVPEIADYLAQTVEMNHLQNLHVEVSAVTNFSGESTLYVPVHVENIIPAGASTLQFHRGPTSAITVPATTLDAFVCERQIPRVDLIKIDTEATEPLVLQGASDLLVRDMPIMICEVLWGETESRLHEILDPIAYRYFWISPQGPIERDRIQGDERYENLNYLFVPEGRYGQLRDRGIL